MRPNQQIDLIAGKMGWFWSWGALGGCWVDDLENEMADDENLFAAGAEAVRDRMVEDGLDCDLSRTSNGASMSLAVLFASPAEGPSWVFVVADVSAPDERTATREAAAQVWRDDK